MRRGPTGVFLDYAALQRAAGLQLCGQCTSQYFNPRNEKILLSETDSIHEDNLSKLSFSLQFLNSPESSAVMEHFTRESSLWRNSDDMICYGCVGFFSYQVVDELADYVMAEICKADALHVPVAVVVYAPPIMDCIRITTRTVITHQHDKTFPFPAVDDLMQRLLTEKLGGRVNIVPTAEAKLKVTVRAFVPDQMRFCATVFPDFKIKRVKRRGPSGGMCGGSGGGGSTGGGASSAEVVQIDSLSMAAAVNEATSAAAAGSESGSRSSMSILRERCAELPQRSIDQVLTHYKSLTQEGFKDLGERLKEYFRESASSSPSYLPPLLPSISEMHTELSLEASTTAAPAAPSAAEVESSEPASTIKDHEMKEFITADISIGKHPLRVRWQVNSETCPLYFLGRYRKLARDVPQSAWTIACNAPMENCADDQIATAGSSAAKTVGSTAQDIDNSGSADGGNDDVATDSRKKLESAIASEGGLLFQRKGRSSIEEIVNEAVCRYFGARECRMHPCGREDIDVRCLGNGRPFALEVLQPSLRKEPGRLEQVQAFINGGGGLNALFDIEVPLLREAERNLWETMQQAAEEKRKGYCCLVWTGMPVVQQQLDALEARCRSGQDRDEEGLPCIEIQQKTPLRVMHRRSLLTRTRRIYDIDTARINDHFFLMRLVTSAGAYVKEFVHGDLGRTTPSLRSILQTPADILQLDVTWLYDDFEGGGGRSGTGSSNISSSNISSSNISSSSNSSWCGTSSSSGSSWPTLKRMRIANFI